MRSSQVKLRGIQVLLVYSPPTVAVVGTTSTNLDIVLLPTMGSKVLSKRFMNPKTSDTEQSC